MPAHDERDWEFAKKFNLPLIQVVAKNGEEVDINAAAFTDVATGVLINSDFLNGLEVKDAKAKMIAFLELSLIHISIRTQLDTITADLTALENNADTSMETVRNLSNKIVTEIANCQKAVDGLRNDFAYNVKPKLENTMSSMQQSMIAAAGILDGVDADFNGVENALSDYQSTLERGSNSLGGSLSMAQELLAKLNSVTADLVSLQQNDQYQELLEIVKSNPEELGAFISSPVNLETVGIYEIENYGSAMSPCYTILALWVGAVSYTHLDVYKRQLLI